jgi:hypothetical protein
MWRIHALRVIYLLIAGVMAIPAWQQVIFESADWGPLLITQRCMIASLALLCVFGIRYPLAMLPVLLLETMWKTAALVFVIFPAFMGERMTPELEVLFTRTIGIIVAYIAITWPYVWARYFRHPGEPWKRQRP